MKPLGRICVGTAFALRGGISLATWDTAGGDAVLLSCVWLAACFELIAGIWLALGVAASWIGRFLLGLAVVGALLLPVSGGSAASAAIALVLGAMACRLPDGPGSAAADERHRRGHHGHELHVGPQW
ncbi:hypothetical protein [Lentzea kentuckyensis]|uniref:hypothetical protein n=1 Tax=Lentzea kentuckyensis TaxID=360086 RepID=UPI000A3B2A82|nr:hypothetical protein [Lentzea kentuckyensis]